MIEKNDSRFRNIIIRRVARAQSVEQGRQRAMDISTVLARAEERFERRNGESMRFVDIFLEPTWPYNTSVGCAYFSCTRHLPSICCFEETKSMDKRLSSESNEIFNSMPNDNA